MVFLSIDVWYRNLKHPKLVLPGTGGTADGAPGEALGED